MDQDPAYRPKVRGLSLTCRTITDWSLSFFILPVRLLVSGSMTMSESELTIHPKGEEMTFPAANNILKKCRSVSAAQQIGLPTLSLMIDMY